MCVLVVECVEKPGSVLRDGLAWGMAPGYGQGMASESRECDYRCGRSVSGRFRVCVVCTGTLEARVARLREARGVCGACGARGEGLRGRSLRGRQLHRMARHGSMAGLLRLLARFPVLCRDCWPRRLEVFAD